jgi:hypothetical protein
MRSSWATVVLEAWGRASASQGLAHLICLRTRRLCWEDLCWASRRGHLIESWHQRRFGRVPSSTLSTQRWSAVRSRKFFQLVRTGLLTLWNAEVDLQPGRVIIAATPRPCWNDRIVGRILGHIMLDFLSGNCICGSENKELTVRLPGATTPLLRIATIRSSDVEAGAGVGVITKSSSRSDLKYRWILPENLHIAVFRRSYRAFQNPNAKDCPFFRSAPRSFDFHILLKPLKIEQETCSRFSYDINPLAV